MFLKTFFNVYDLNSFVNQLFIKNFIMLFETQNLSQILFENNKWELSKSLLKWFNQFISFFYLSKEW
jgi:hypothetical protein